VDSEQVVVFIIGDGKRTVGVAECAQASGGVVDELAGLARGEAITARGRSVDGWGLFARLDFDVPIRVVFHVSGAIWVQVISKVNTNVTSIFEVNKVSRYFSIYLSI
jgi:hypothetical protein